MPDLYYDAVFGRLVQPSSVNETSIFVDEVATWPTNDLLSAAQFRISFDAPLTRPFNFEVAIVQAVNFATGEVTLAAPLAYEHPAGTYVKGALTAAMLRQLRAGEAGSGPPTIRNDDVYNFGDRYYDWVYHTLYVYGQNGFEPVGSGGGGGGETDAISPFLLMGA